MRVIIQRDWNNCVAGREMEIPDGPANELIRRGIAKCAGVVECMAANTENHRTAMLDRKPRKRG